MKDVLQQLYNGILRFFPLKNYLKFKTSPRGDFPRGGFLTTEKIRELEQILSVQIRNLEYFEQALTHRSYIQVIGAPDFLSNERLEFLGDAILDMVVAEYLFLQHSKVFEGDLTKMRSWLVNKNALVLFAKKIILGEFLLMSHSAEKSLKSGSDSILADALEALIAAIYLDSGFQSAKKFIVDSILPELISQDMMVDTNYKSSLLESLQARCKKAPVYQLLEDKGPDHDKEFIVGVYLDERLLASGAGKSKKQAEQDAAYNALNSDFVRQLKSEIQE